jgi:DNA-binding transcriptional ArsR family regulator
VNIDVPPKSTQTDSALSGVGRYKRSPDQGEETRAAIIRVLAERPGASIRDLCTAVGKSSASTVYAHLHRLEAEGKIVKDQCPVCRAGILRVV